MKCFSLKIGTKLVALTLLCIHLTFSSVAMANIDSAQAEDVIAAFNGSSFSDFNDFLTQLEALTIAQASDVAETIQSFQSGSALTTDQNNVLYRLLGLYTRLQYADEALEILAQLVAIPTFAVEGLEQHNNPNFHRFAEAIELIAADFNLDFRNVDNRIYEISLDGSSSELIGIHAHADVVPVTPSLWVLEDGTQLDPFVMTRIGNRLYGRGTEDDKNGIVVSMFAMKVIKEEGLPLLRDFKLLIDTTEETSSDAIPYYFERNPTPAYNLALDGSYPVVIAEKGYGTVTGFFPVRQGSGEGAEILSFTGGLATNQIPAKSIAQIATQSPASLVETLNQAGGDYVLSHGSNFDITALMTENGLVELSVTGVSAHSSDPASGINPVSRMLDFIHSFSGQQTFKSNHITDAAHYASENWGLDYLGGNLDLGFSNDFMGPLTTALTFVGLNDTVLRLTVNLRIPVGEAPLDLQAEIADKLTQWVGREVTDVRFEYSVSDPMYRNPAGNWVNALLDVASENLDMEREFGSSSGGTSVHNLPNGVQFGLSMPDEKYTGHNANEFKRIEQFLLDLQIAAEMFIRIGSIPEL